MVIAADRPDAFDREVLQADLPVMVDFWAPWCGPCRMVSPEVEAIGKEYAGRLKVVKVNVDENPEAAARYNVRGIPTIGLFTGGKLVKQVVGARPRHAIVSELGLNFWAPARRPGDEQAPPGTPSRPDGRY